ncbi:MAG: sensor histidine kinase, partial [Oscillospiraceae bacterium]|nr:sensor histidine kinase [Oscillospiraceae bacterium]
MLKAIFRIRDKFLSNRLDFRVRLFNVLAMGGISICFISTITCIVNGENILSIGANILAGFVAYGLMWYASKSGRYRLCYILTIIIIFLLVFPFIFFVGGGYNGAMPSFFIFGVVFTVFMLEGR